MDSIAIQSLGQDTTLGRSAGRRLGTRGAQVGAGPGRQALRHTGRRWGAQVGERGAQQACKHGASELGARRR